MTTSSARRCSNVRSAVRLHVVLFCTLCLCGCSSIGRALDQFDEAIAEIGRMRRLLETESGEWRQQLDDMQFTLTQDVKSVINEDLRDYTDRTIHEFGIEVRCEMDFVSSKLLAFLDAVEQALINKRDQLEREGTLKDQTPEEIIRQVIASIGHIPPHVCHSDGGEVTFEYIHKYGEPIQIRAKKPESTVRIVGFALQRRDTDDDGISIVIRDKDSRERAVANADTLITTNSSYELLVDVAELATHLQSADRQVILRWRRESITALKITFGPLPTQPPTPPPPPVFAESGVVGGTGGVPYLDKKEPVSRITSVIIRAKKTRRRDSDRA